jgi:hypothetical protein
MVRRPADPAPHLVNPVQAAGIGRLSESSPGPAGAMPPATIS